jgi:N utilization substance protein B
MVNRTLIRIKILQIVYACCQKNSVDLVGAEKELSRSLQQSFDLYHYLLVLINLITEVEQRRTDVLQRKFLRSESETPPNLRMAANRLAEQLRDNETLEKFVTQNGSLWVDDDASPVRTLHRSILESEIYEEYLRQPDDYENDRDFWRKCFKEIILENEELSDLLEEKNIYWSDSLDIEGTFILKTIKQFDPAAGRQQALLPMFRNEEDREFATKLLHRAILEHEENEELINRRIKNWDVERIASIDLYIMQIALAEIKNFPAIPVSVSLNEYIDLARYYSTPKSGVFINGLLDGIVTELKNDNKLSKN